MNDKNKDGRKKEVRSAGGIDNESQSPTVDISSTLGNTTSVGDKDRKIIDTGDISRASIAKGIRSPDDGNVTAADIVKGTTTKPEDVISYTTGISTENGKVLNPNTEASITKELDKDIAAATTTNNNTEDVSKLVSSGTSSKSYDGGIDKNDIYSSDDDGTRHLEKVQNTQTTTEKVNDKKATNTES
jgi:hypothetical protein